MRANVLEDGALAKHAGQFVWLSIDTEKPVNAGFTEKFPINGWPSFLVIDPRREKSVFIWPGSSTVRGMERLFEDGLVAYRGGGGPAQQALVAGDRAGAEKNWKDAAAEYRKAVTLGGPDWPRRPRATESLVGALMSSDQQQTCAQTAVKEAPGMPPGQSFANAVNTGFGCAVSGKDAPWGKEAAARLAPLAEKAVRGPDVLADDRSALYLTLVRYYRQQKRTAEADSTAAQWLSVLEKEVAGAKTGAERQALDTHLVQAARQTKQMDRVLPELQASEREFPKEYMASLTLASAYRELGRYDDAIAATDRALEKSYGPMKANIYMQRSIMQQQKGDFAGARKSVEEGLAYAETLPPAEAKTMKGRLQKRLAEFDRSGAGPRPAMK